MDAERAATSRAGAQETLNGRASGASLWLMPEGEARRELAAWIERLAERLETESFAPHVTLVSGADGLPADLAAAARRAAAELRPFTVRLEGVEGRDEHFRRLFVRAVLDGPLREAHAVASRALGREPQPDFLPHLSLVYGPPLLPDKKQGLAHEVGPEVSLRFEARAIHLWSTEGTVAQWRELGAFPFGGA